MPKKCIICTEEAIYKIKDTPDYYCEECAEENFADISVLIKVEEEAQRLKEAIKGKMGEILETEEELDKMIKVTEKKEISEEEKKEDVQDDKTG
jgi:hypothetical protein